MRLLLLAWLLAVAGLLPACATHTNVALLQAAGMPVTQTPRPEVPLEVVTRSTGIRDPLPVEGTGVTYGDVETSLGHAISTAAVPWAEAHKDRRPEGWQLQVEMTQADATYSGGRLIVTINVRATLRTRVGRAYLAQSQASCRQSGVIPAEQGAPVVFSCMERLGRDLAGWLEQVEP
jgi:hypothetical protein